MATAEELQNYLAKRGYSAEVSKDADTFTIGISCKTTEEIASVLAGIAEPGRFIVSVQLTDVAGVLGIPQLEEYVAALNSRLYNLEDDVLKNTRRLEESDEALKRQGEASIGSLQQSVEELRAEIAKLNSVPWWKRFTGVR